MPSMSPEAMAASSQSVGKEKGIDEQRADESCCHPHQKAPKWTPSVWLNHRHHQKFWPCMHNNVVFMASHMLGLHDRSNYFSRN